MKKLELAIHGGPKTISDKLAMEIQDAKRWPRISEETIQKCSDLLRKGAISIAHGSIIDALEKKFREYNGSRYCLVQNNGTSALHAAYFALGLKPGDEVIVPSHTWTATVAPLLPLGAVPVFCDIDPDTLLIDPDDIERKITSRTKAISIVHLWGNVCDMERIMSISEKYGIPVIEDCSHAHGATYKGKRVGTFGAIGCFSMQGSKAVPGGELGAVITDECEYFDRMVILGHQGRVGMTAEKEEFKRYEAGLGFKYRPFPIAVQIALDQMNLIDETNLQRRITVELYNRELQGIKYIKTVKQLTETERGCYNYIFIFESEKAGISTQKFVEALNAEGLDVALMRYKMVHTIPPFDKYLADIPITLRLVPQMIATLPFTISDKENIALYVKKFTEGVRKVIDNIDKLR